MGSIKKILLLTFFLLNVYNSIHGSSDELEGEADGKTLEEKILKKRKNKLKLLKKILIEGETKNTDGLNQSGEKILTHEEILEVQAKQIGLGRDILALKDQLTSFEFNKAQKTIEPILKYYKGFSEAELEEQFMEVSKGTLLEKVFYKCPKANILIVKFIQSREAILGLFKLLGNRTKLWIFLGINIVIILMSWRWKSRIYNQYPKSFSRTGQQLKRIIIIKILQLGFFAFYWQDEVGPSFKIAYKVFMT